MKLYWLIVVACMSAVWWVNDYADVAGLDVEVSELAARQSARQVVVSERQLNQRQWVQARLSRACPARLVLGSSTMGTLEARMFERGPTLNAWLTGPMIEDWEALTGVLAERECWPATIVLGLDGFMFNEEEANQRWRAWEESRIYFLHQSSQLRRWVALAQRRFTIFKDRLSYESTRDSVSALMERDGAAAPVQAQLLDDDARLCARLPRLVSVRHADGHFSYCPTWLAPTERRHEIARTYVARDFHRVRSWARVSHARIAALRRVLDAWRERGVQVVLVVPPYNPLTYAAIAAHAPVAARFAEMDEALRELARATGARLLELRDPARVGCAEAEYYDGHHFGPACAERVADRVQALELR